MTAVIRIKRRLEEEPLETVIINCKRRKTDDNEQEAQISTVFKLTTTLKTQEENILKHIKKPTKCEVQESYKKHIVDIHEKIRQQNQIEAKNNRYRIVNLHRPIGSTTSDIAQKEDDSEITIVDIETDECKESDAHSSSDLRYVYDLYYTNSDDFAEVDLNELISVYPLSDELVYGSARDNGCENEEYTDDSDSNDENNWRNDYPDESEVESITEEDMLEAMNRVDLNGENELSSDDAEEGFIYSIDSEGCGFEEDVDPTDVNRFGERYARFKARAKKTEDRTSHDLYSENSNDEDDDYYY